MEHLREELKCPLTHDLLDDPVSVPCCGKAMSRVPLAEWLSRRQVCPCCNGDLSHFDVMTAAKNVVLAGMVDAISNRIPAVEVKEQEWKCSLTPIKAGSRVAEMKLVLEEAKFATRPSLFIAVVDESGSMSGQPMDQVRMALRHIEELAKINEQVKLVIVSYSSGAVVIQDIDEYGKRCSGTNFRAAFAKIDEVLRSYMCSERKEDQQRPNNVSTVTIAFMTDGQDGSGNRPRLVPEFREMLHNRWGENPLSVHAVGFGRGCDRELLEQMRLAGTIEGMYRYAEPGDDGDALCNKLTGIFEVSSKASSVPIDITVNQVRTHVRFPVDARKYGEYKQWITINRGKQNTVVVNSTLDANVNVPVTLERPNEVVFQRWLARCVDQLANELLQASKEQMSENVKALQCALLEKCIDALLTVEDGTLGERLEFLRAQVESLRVGTAVNVGKLSDLRFSSMFSAPTRPETKTTIVTMPPAEPLALPEKPYFERPLKRYSRNNEGQGRNEFQEAIVAVPSDVCTPRVQQLLKHATLEDILHRDTNGNNALMLAAYCGHCSMVTAILDKFPGLDLEINNDDGETAVTLAIKKRGFHHTLGVLLDRGANLPRRKPLERFAIDNGYSITAQVIANFGDASFEVDETMTKEYFLFVYQRAKQQPEEKWNKNSFLNVALAKGLKNVAIELMEGYAVPTIDMLVKHCIPPKPDHPETERYLELARVVLQMHPELLREKTEPEQNTALIMAAKKGSLPHVKYFIEQKAEIEAKNEKGNTALWVASFMRYPCIMDELMKHGANVNHENLKGNVPLYGPCCRGPPKIAQQLIARGANVDHVNSNGDTLILLCCRNGTHEVLHFLLNYVDEDFVNFKAHIDGFNAIMASAEQDRPDCIRVLQEFGIDLDQKTDEDNAILAGATPLHIAAYYGRAKAAGMLVQLGADPNAKDIHGSTPMHIAVIQGSTEVIRVLRDRVDPGIKDDAGNTPIAYCRNNEEIRKLLVSPLLDPLTKLVQGGFTREEESKALEILRSYEGIPGVLNSGRSLDVRDSLGVTPLTQAVIYGKRDLVKIFVDKGCSALVEDSLGVRLHTWAQWSRNMRINNTLPPIVEVGLVEGQVQNLMEEARNPASAEMLFLGIAPGYEKPVPSSILQRMELFLNAPCAVDLLAQKFNLNLPRIEASDTHVVHYFEDKELDEIKQTRLIWEAKLHTIRHVAVGSQLNASELMALCMFTNNPKVSEVLNTSLLQREFKSNLIRDYIGVLHQGLQKLPEFKGEVFIGSAVPNRKLFMKGVEFTWNRFVSGSTLWRVALENTPSFTSKARRGTVFILKSKTGRLVGPYSQYSYDAEVIFLPTTRFRVSNWYHGDVIALGQENIREHTFGIKERDDERLDMAHMVNSDKALIIELTEI